MTNNAEWWKKGVFYQVYPRSYMDKNGDGVGDIAGITDRLNYIADLGIDGLWISPCFESPMKDFGYDVSDYRKIDSLFGSNQDFDVLLKKAHDFGIKVIVDMVMSHTSDQHMWFKESRLGNDNRKKDWYVWTDPKPDGSPPNNWQSIFGGPAWTYDTKRCQYYMHSFLKEQPDLNYHNPDVRNQMLSECEYWLEMGVDGFRLDAFNHCFHDEKLRDNPVRDMSSLSTGLQIDSVIPYSMQQHVHDKSQPEMIGLIQDVRALMDKYPDTMTLGEIGDDDPYARTAEYTSGNDKLNTAYNIHFIAGSSSTNLTPEKIKLPFREVKKYPNHGWPSWAFTNHDAVRVATRWGKGVQDRANFAALLNKLLLSLRGTPFLYQGDELGLPEAVIPFDQIQDPWGKFMWPEWQGRDGCRTPMPWNKDAVAAGFSTNTNDRQPPWLPIPTDHKKLAVNLQDEDPKSTLNQTRDFIKWRKTQPLLQTGEIEFDENSGEDIIAFDRFDGDARMTCIFNIKEKESEYKGSKYAPLSATYIAH